MTWRIVLSPEGRNDDKVNGCGMVVKLTNGSTTQEVSRVGFVRRESHHPEVPFDEQLAVEVGKARTAAKLLNEQLQGTGELA